MLSLWLSSSGGVETEVDSLVLATGFDAETAWVTYVNDLADQTIYPTCNAWYLGANVPGKPRVFMPHVGFPPYVEKCEDVVARGFEGFRFP